MSYVIAYVTAAVVMGGFDYLWLTNTSGPVYHRALGAVMAENPNKPGDWYPDNFICMWMDKLLIKYTYLMAAIADAESSSGKAAQ